MHAFILALLLSCGGGSQGSDRELCGDGYDNDGDGLADCADPDCFGALVDFDGDGDREPCPELCTDGEDNDGDGLVDCEDPGCDGTPGCPEVCTDGRDNDKDGKWDCLDSDCLEQCDADQDGYLNAEFGGDDCDDNNPDAYPLAPEVCDGADNDCNGYVDLEDPGLDRTTLTTFYLDLDGDGFGQTYDAIEECFQPLDRVPDPGDCDDTDPYVHPAAVELCDGIDNDCDALFDDADPDVDLASAQTWYPDLDGDGFGVNSNPVDSCAPPPNTANNPNDCDDTNPGITDPGDWIQDLDGDGYGSGAPVGPTGCTPPGPDYVSDNTPIDCDEGDPAVNPGAPDPCGDGIDWNCDGLDCSSFFEGFEYGLNVPWTTGGNQPWFAQQNTVHTGASAAECGNIGDSQQSWIAITRSFPAGGEVVFWHTGSTESNWDYLRVYIDGAMMGEWSGTWGWTETSYAVGAGLHDIEWRYEKDASLSAGADTVWLDDVELRGATP